MIKINSGIIVITKKAILWFKDGKGFDKFKDSHKPSDILVYYYKPWQFIHDYILLCKKADMMDKVKDIIRREVDE